MKFVLLLVGPESDWDGASEEERAEVMRRIGEFRQRYGARMVGGEELASVAGARTLRRSGGVTSVTDGPYAETKDVVGGYVLIEADDIDAAVTMAADWPTLRDGSGGIEVRPVVE